MLEGKELYEKLKANLETEFKATYGEKDDYEMAVLTPHLLCELGVKTAIS